jgi:hypothetical protein
MKHSYIETRSRRVNKSFIILLLLALLTINRLAKSLAKATEAKARPKMRTDDFGNIFEDQPTWEQSYETFYGRQSGIS